jgi:YggT family protein
MLFVIRIINFAYYAVVILIFARIILSFVQIGPYEIRNFIFRLTEPLLAPIRNILPPMGGFDFSPMVVIILAEILRRVLISIIIS